LVHPTIGQERIGLRLCLTRIFGACYKETLFGSAFPQLGTSITHYAAKFQSYRFEVEARFGVPAVHTERQLGDEAHSRLSTV
jgi:hypothetical protein